VRDISTRLAHIRIRHPEDDWIDANGSQIRYGDELRLTADEAFRCKVHGSFEGRAVVRWGDEFQFWGLLVEPSAFVRVRAP